MLAFRLFPFIFCLLISPQLLSDCTSLAINKSSIEKLANFSINTSVLVMDDELKKSVYESIIEFKLSTIQLSNQEANPEMLSEWYQNIHHLKKIAFESIRKKMNIQDENKFERISSLLVDGFVDYWVTRAYSTVKHEAGHGTFMLSQGYDGVEYGHDASIDGQKLTIGELFSKLIIRPNSAYAISVGHRDPKFASRLESEAEIFGAGLNEETKEAERISKEAMDSGKFNVLDALSYNLFKRRLRSYSGLESSDPVYEIGDPLSYAKELKLQGMVPEDRTAESIVTEIHQLSVLTSLLSGGTWNSAKSVINFVNKGEINSDTIKLKFKDGTSVDLPEFSTYLNGSNVSVSSQLHINLPAKKEEIIKSIDVRLEKSVIGGGPVSLQSPDQAAEKKDIAEFSVRTNFESDSKKIKSYLEMTANNFNGYGINAGVTWLLSSDTKNPDGGWFVSMDVSKTKKTMKGSRENCRSGEFEGCETLYFGLGYRQ